MKYLSLCSGIEAATVAWHPLGWEAVAYSDIERFPSEVLAHHYPSTPNLGDMTKFKEWTNVSDVDVLVGGTPCQSFSVAGLRKGLDDPRGNLMLTYLAIAKRYRPNWLVWENVPGVLSSNGGRDFGSFLGGLAECGYGFAYRVLDAQYFGVAQRRRRVFVVGYLGDWRAAAAVLFERHSLQGHPAPSREKRQGAAASARAGVVGGGWPADISSTLDTTFGTKQGLENQHINAGCPMFVPVVKTLVGLQDCNNFSSEITGTIVTRKGCAADTAHMVMQPIALAENTIGRQPQNGGNGDGFTDGGPMYTLNATGVHAVAQPIAVGTDLYNGNITGDVAATMGTPGSSSNASGPTVMQSVVAPTLTAANDPSRSPQSSEVTNQVYSVYQSSMAVRRLTPIECERLQGFPDSYTDIKSKNKPTPDGPRYKALGNSMAVPVMAWIGQRIEQVEAICKQNK
jgi:DNA (cytosine-5)-methyltransferase 1